MKIVKSKYFGNIDIDNIEDCYECELKYKDTIIYPLLTFEESYFSTKSILEKDVKSADSLIENYEPYIEKSFNKIKKSYKKKETVREYIEHHIKEFKNGELDKLGIDTKQSKKKIHKEFLNRLQFTGLGIDPTNKQESLTLDFTISEDLTQYLIAVRINKKGKVSEIVMES